MRPKSGQNHNCKQTSINLQKFPKCSPGIGKRKTPNTKVLELGAPHPLPRSALPPPLSQMNGTNSHWPHTNRYLIFAISCRASLVRRRAACRMLQAAWCIMQCQTLCWPENKYELNLFAPKLSLALSTRKCASDTLYVPRSGIKTNHFTLLHEARETPRAVSNP